MIADPKAVRRTPMRNIVKEKPGPKGNGFQADTPLKSFELFFDDAVITKFVIWTNQTIENVKTSYTRKPGFLYNTSMTEIRELIGILLFLGATKCSKKVLQAFGRKMVLASQFASSDESEASFVSCVLLTL